MTIEDQIEINASPERVREVFLDFAKYKEWHTEYISSIAPVEEGKIGKELAKGDKLKILIHGQKFEAVITENTPTTFQWQGPPVYTIAGLHTFEFLPSSVTPGSTTFCQNEIHKGALSFMLAPNLPTGKSVKVDFETLCRDLKRRAEER